MDRIQDFSDRRQKAWCVHCTRLLATVEISHDHAPTKSLLRAPLPLDLPYVRACQECNQSFSNDEEYFVAFLSAVISGTTDPVKQRHPNAARIFEQQPALRARIDKSVQQLLPFTDQPELMWTPETNRIEKVILKNARNHALFEIGEPMLDPPTHIHFTPLQQLSPVQREQFENLPDPGVWPEVGSRMMTRMMTGQDLDGPWVIVQDDVYRYAVAQMGTMMVRSVIFGYLATEVYWE